MLIRSVLAAAALGLSTMAAAADPSGVWTMPKGKATIRIAECGGSICATLVGLKKPNDKQGRPKIDKKNPDPALRDRPVIGVSLLSDMKREGDVWKGRFYNPDDGQTYDGEIASDGADKLKLKGCLAEGVLCKTQVLTRAE